MMLLLLFVFPTTVGTVAAEKEKPQNSVKSTGEQAVVLDPSPPGKIIYINPNIPKFKHPEYPGEYYKALVPATLDLAERAYGHDFDRSMQDANIGCLAKELGDRQFESGTRRQFVKAAVTLIEAQRRGGDRRLSDADVRTLAGGVEPAGPELMDGEAEF